MGVTKTTSPEKAKLFGYISWRLVVKTGMRTGLRPSLRPTGSLQGLLIRWPLRIGTKGNRVWIVIAGRACHLVPRGVLPPRRRNADSERTEEPGEGLSGRDAPTEMEPKH